MLSNNGLCLCTAAQYVLLFLVRFNNSDRFQIYVVTRSYSSRPFLCALGQSHPLCRTGHVLGNTRFHQLYWGLERLPNPPFCFGGGSGFETRAWTLSLRKLGPVNIWWSVIVGVIISKSAQERAARGRACNYIKFQTGWNLPPVLKIVTCMRSWA